MSSVSSPAPQPRRAIIFALLVVFIDIAGVGLILPVMPRLIESVGHVGLVDAAEVGPSSNTDVVVPPVHVHPLDGFVGVHGRIPIFIWPHSHCSSSRISS